jgi:lipoate-protein ligase A
MVDGRKLAGSAQKRINGAVLQHGSIPLTPAFRNLPNFENISDEEKLAQKDLLEKKCACISEIAADCTIGQLADALAEGFGKTLGLKVVFDGWTEKEREDIELSVDSFRFDGRLRKETC